MDRKLQLFAITDPRVYPIVYEVYKKSLPLVAIMAGATTRKVKNVTLINLALFRVGSFFSKAHNLHMLSMSQP
jgi:hypothetical protein